MYSKRFALLLILIFFSHGSVFGDKKPQSCPAMVKPSSAPKPAIFASVALAPSVVMPAPTVLAAPAPVVVNQQMEAAAVTASPVLPEQSVSNRLYQAALKYNEKEMRAILAQAKAQSREELINDALAYADLIKHDAQTTRTLMEVLIESRKSWFARNCLFTTVLVPTCCALASAIFYAWYYSSKPCVPKGECWSPRGSSASDEGMVEMPRLSSETGIGVDES